MRPHEPIMQRPRIAQRALPRLLRPHPPMPKLARRARRLRGRHRRRREEIFPDRRRGRAGATSRIEGELGRAVTETKAGGTTEDATAGEGTTELVRTGLDDTGISAEGAAPADELGDEAADDKDLDTKVLEVEAPFAEDNDEGRADAGGAMTVPTWAGAFPV
ncbi:hypothetical protein C0993_012811, partial [Termitomyces sp. T159_Od127]